MTDIAVTDPAVVALVCAVLLLAGTVKGVVGLGLPTVTLALLTATLGLDAAIAVMLAPSLVTNLWQAFPGGAFVALMRRLWPFYLTLSIATLLTASAAPTLIPAAILTALLGASVAAYGLFGLATPPVALGRRLEGPLSPLAGLTTGILTGMTGSFVLPAVPFLQALDLPRDRLVQAMGMTFLAATVALGAGFGGQGMVPASLAALSALAVLPALVGMELGRRIRGRLSERRFRQALFLSLLALGVWILVKPWL